MNTKIAIVQFNPIVGDIDGNTNRIIAAYDEAASEGADLVVFPECALTGYPLEDLVLRESFMDAVAEKVKFINTTICANKTGPAIIYGTPRRVPRGIRNVAYMVDPQIPPYSPQDGQYLCSIQAISKTELPNYGVFDEKRVFISGERPYPIDFRGHKIGLMICEDCWFPRVSKEMMDQGAQFLISINGSPFEVGKNVVRHNVIKDRVNETGLPFLYVNMVGGQDELVFDGGSFLYDGNLKDFPSFKEDTFYVEVNISSDNRYINNAGEAIIHISDDGEHSQWIKPPEPLVTVDNYPTVEPTGFPEIYQACVLGTRDYMQKQGFKSVVIGYSGGVDSGLVAAIAADAVGPDNVHLVRLPSKYSSQHSLNDAAAGSDRLHAKMRSIYIEPVVEALRQAYANATDHGNYPEHNVYNGGHENLNPRKLVGVADENIQARARGNILMAISNQEHHLLLTTGNKSEVSVGYATLYGDMSGGFNPIKDLYKTTVWELCRWRNNLSAQDIEHFGFFGTNDEVVPEAIITKPPSAELRPDQFDEQSLPPYPVLDSLLRGMIEDELSVDEIAMRNNLDRSVVMKIRQLVDNAEYKRRQAAPGVKITSKIHGRDRRYPIVNKWRV